MPAEGLPWLERDDVLSFEEIERLVALLAQMGVADAAPDRRRAARAPRLPARWPRCSRAVDDLARSVTTNGFLLERDAAALVAAGIARFNVSIDSLQRDRFFEKTRRDALPRVLRASRTLAAVPRGAPDQGQRGRHPRLHRGRGPPVRPLRPRAPLRGALHRVHAARRRPRVGHAQVLTGDEIRARDPRGLPARRRRPRDPHATARVLPLRRRPRAASASSTRSPSRSAATATASASPPTAGCAPACSASTRPTCAARCAPARPTTTSSRSSATRCGARSSSTGSTSPASCSPRGPCPPSADDERSRTRPPGPPSAVKIARGRPSRRGARAAGRRRPRRRLAPDGPRRLGRSRARRLRPRRRAARPPRPAALVRRTISWRTRIGAAHRHGVLVPLPEPASLRLHPVGDPAKVQRRQFVRVPAELSTAVIAPDKRLTTRTLDVASAACSSRRPTRSRSTTRALRPRPRPADDLRRRHRRPRQRRGHPRHPLLRSAGASERALSQLRGPAPARAHRGRARR